MQSVKTLEAQKVFGQLAKHNVDSWGTLSCGFAQSILSFFYKGIRSRLDIDPDNTLSKAIIDMHNSYNSIYHCFVI